MAKNLAYEGKHMVITAGADQNSGDLVIVEDIAAVCLVDIPNTAKGAAAIEGVWELAKETHATDKALAQGAKVFWNATEKRVEKLVGDPAQPCIGIAFEAAASTADKCLVKINVAI